MTINAPRPLGKQSANLGASLTHLRPHTVVTAVKPATGRHREGVASVGRRSRQWEGGRVSGNEVASVGKGPRQCEGGWRWEAGLASLGARVCGGEILSLIHI
eukprot:3506361-Prymnesium_polylepis.1